MLSRQKRFLRFQLHYALFANPHCFSLVTATSFLCTSSSTRRQGKPSALRMNAPCIEIEEKFSLTDANLSKLKDRLKQAGFVETKSTTMVDWYFDTSSCDLTRQDCWLRFRTKGSGAIEGQWQLKQGRNDHLSSSTSGSSPTIYNEIEGDAAIDNVCSILLSTTRSDSAPVLQSDFVYTDQVVPTFPRLTDPRLTPFARILTQRETWEQDNKGDRKLAVDLDSTDFGYAVGEVEVVVNEESEIEEAQSKIREVINTLVEDKKAITPPGKLEFYLERYRSNIHKQLVECGVIRSPSQ